MTALETPTDRERSGSSGQSLFEGIQIMPILSELIPREGIRFGYDNPSNLPQEIIALRDAELPSERSADFLF